MAVLCHADQQRRGAVRTEVCNPSFFSLQGLFFYFSGWGGAPGAGVGGGVQWEGAAWFPLRPDSPLRIFWPCHHHKNHGAVRVVAWKCLTFAYHEVIKVD